MLLHLDYPVAAIFIIISHKAAFVNRPPHILQSIAQKALAKQKKTGNGTPLVA
jgi:hypothetical protein